MKRPVRPATTWLAQQLLNAYRARTHGRNPNVKVECDAHGDLPETAGPITPP